MFGERQNRWNGEITLRRSKVFVSRHTALKHAQANSVLTEPERGQTGIERIVLAPIGGVPIGKPRIAVVLHRVERGLEVGQAAGPAFDQSPPRAFERFTVGRQFLLEPRIEFSYPLFEL